MIVNLAILLCTYNGEKFLQEQLDSFTKQSFKGWHLFVYDDRSIDDTKNIIEKYKEKSKNTSQVDLISNNLKMGFARNFLNAISKAPDNFEYYALADQDDIWLESKLQKAVSYLENINNSIPALYCSRTILVNNDGVKYGYSLLFTRLPSFRNALVQSIAGGNSMVFNKAARDLIVRAGGDLDIVSHDWFIYQLITGAGGKICYDTNPGILYRQHGNNLIGSNAGLLAKLSRIKMLFQGSFKEWNDRNIQVLKNNLNLLTEENINILSNFIKIRESSLIGRLSFFLKSRIYRQTFCGNIALFVGVLFNKV